MCDVSHKLLINDKGKYYNLMELKTTLYELPKDKKGFEEVLGYYKDLKIIYNQETQETAVKILIELPHHQKEELITEAIEKYVDIRKTEFLEKCHYALDTCHGDI